MPTKSMKKPAPPRTPRKNSEETAARHGTVFVCDLKPDAKEVYVVGDFNNWDPRSDRLLKKKGTFQKTVRLAPGEYEYKFLVDGEWHCDPSAPRQVKNEFGTLNSVVRVKDSSGK